MMNEGVQDVSLTEKHDSIFQSNISNMTRYMRFIGVYNIVLGVIYCFGIITAIVGIPIIAGNR